MHAKFELYVVHALQNKDLLPVLDCVFWPAHVWNCVLMLMGFKLFSKVRGARYAARDALHFWICSSSCSLSSYSSSSSSSSSSVLLFRLPTAKWCHPQTGCTLTWYVLHARGHPLLVPSCHPLDEDVLGQLPVQWLGLVGSKASLRCPLCVHRSGSYCLTPRSMQHVLCKVLHGPLACALVSVRVQ